MVARWLASPSTLQHDGCRLVVSGEDRFGRGKVVNSILRNVASYLGYKEKAQLEALYEKTAWRFDRKAGHKSASFNFFKRAIE